jgi:hypothetical protein
MQAPITTTTTTARIHMRVRVLRAAVGHKLTRLTDEP